MLSLPDTLTQTQASDCLKSLSDGVQREADARVVVDAGLLRSFDSSALAVLLAVRRECARAGKHFAVHALPDRLRALAALYGVEALLPSA